jgi:hypothetical protein
MRAVLIVGAFVACVPPPAQQAPPVYVSSTASVDVHANDDPAPSPPAAWHAVQVLVDKRIDRPTEVIGVFDFHTPATSEDKGFDELRERAAAMGADAVIGAEFEHGDDGGPSHLSGMAVRFLDH